MEELYVYDAPPSLDLGAFGASDDSPDILFPKLEKLQLLYRGGDDNNIQVIHEDGRPRRFHFPQLRDISVDCRWSRCPHIEDAVFPAAVDSFSIAGSAALLTAVAAKSLPTTQNLVLEVVDDSGNARSAFAAINSILSSMRPCKKATLNIADEYLSVLPKDITFTGLTNLVIASPTSVHTIIELVRKLPQLVSLYISAYLSGVTDQQLGEFVANYSHRYPHLSNIRLLG
ncbi:hypothetical protein H4R21_001187 [Coemansia helicoidea]|uniref:Uncharacterized protein n=1 Tax=Coemansia helicoidea TaxID=1286919 RepID=A0ACC1LE04_9FUNG|nr:hypothetical protein H4R21_001187 [Coemansia helicoidea]